MAFYVDKQLYFDFYLNGYSIPVTLTDINSLAIVNNRFDLLPALRLDINDTKAIFSKGALSDGAIISIAVGNDQESALKNMMEFMYVSSPSESVRRSSDRYLIYGLYNFPRFIYCQEPFGFHGTSNQCLEALAKECGLDYDGIATTDEMTWLNGNMKYGQFSKFIASHGYSSPTSLMETCVTLDRKLRYRNLNDIKTEYTFTEAPVANTELEKKINLKEISFKNKAASNNSFYGYSNQMVDYNLDGSVNVNSEIAFDKTTNVVNVNKKLYDQSGVVRNEIRPTNIGNFHENWTKAYYQNKRYQALNSVEAVIYTDSWTPLEVLDGANISLIDPMTTSPDTVKAQKWIVDAKTIAISGRSYVEKYVLSSSGMEADLFNDLM